MLEKIDQNTAVNAYFMLASLGEDLKRREEIMIAFDAVAGTAVSYRMTDDTAHHYKRVPSANLGFHVWREVTE